MVRSNLAVAVLAAATVLGCAHAPDRAPAWGDRAAAPGVRDGAGPDAISAPRYTVEALGFHANDEAGYDSPFFAPWSSDEIVVVIRDDERGVITLSRIFEDVDSGESRSFRPEESCILPIDGPSEPSGRLLAASYDLWRCASAGIPGRFGFTVELHEEDSGFFRDCLDGLSAELGCSFSLLAGHGGHNDLIGKRTLEFSAAELASAMPNVGDTFDQTIKLGDCHDADGCVDSPGLPTGPEYTFTYRLTRLPSALQDPVLDSQPD